MDTVPTSQARLRAVAAVREGLEFGASSPPADRAHAFTDDGWARWIRMLAQTDVTGYVMLHRASAEPETGDVSATSDDACDGYHVWTFSMPVTVHYEAFGMTETQNLHLTLTLRQDADPASEVKVVDASAD